MDDWLEHDKKVTTLELDYKGLKEIENILSEKLNILEKVWKNSKDSVDRKDYQHLVETRKKICNAMFKIDNENPVKEL